MYVVRNALLVVLLVATAACGAYRFPGPAGGTGTVSGQVIAYTCGPVQPVNQKCIPGPPAADCMPENPTCGGYPMPGVELTFTNGDATHGIKSNASGYYSIQLPAGTWTVRVLKFVRIMSGPETVVVTPGASIVANYVVDTGIRAAA